VQEEPSNLEEEEEEDEQNEDDFDKRSADVDHQEEV
jgi:hypothetical protein